MYYHKSTKNVKGHTILIFIVRCVVMFIYEEIVLKSNIIEIKYNLLS